MSAPPTSPTRRDVRVGVYRGVAGLVALFLLAVSSLWLLWPFGIYVIKDLAEPENARWLGGSWGALGTFMLALPLVATLRRPREAAGILQFHLAGYAVITVGSMFVLAEPLTIDQVIPFVLLIASYPAPRALLKVPRSVDRRLLGVTVVAALAAVPIVTTGSADNAAHLGSEAQAIGAFHHAGWIATLAILALLFAALRVDGAAVPVRLAGIAVAYLGMASMIVPDQAGSWGFYPGLAALVGGGLVAMLPRFMANSDAASSRRQYPRGHRPPV